jgi:hypothetical protein
MGSYPNKTPSAGEVSLLQVTSPSDRADPHPYEHTTRLTVTRRRSDGSLRRCDGCHPYQLIRCLMLWRTRASFSCSTR